MHIQPYDYLRWERASPSAQDHPEYWTEPRPVRDCLPEWFVDLPGNLQNLNLDTSIPDHNILISHGMRSAKLCLGLRGVRNLGWTIPLTQAYNQDYPGLGTVAYKEVWLHPAMLTGSRFSQRNEDGSYQWGIRLLSFPWRACMVPGWRLLITAHPLTWSPDWFCFSGCVDANYRHNGRNIGSFWDFDQDMDPELNYYNIEVVVAIRTGSSRPAVIPADTCVFSMIPVYDPEYQAPDFKEFPDFVTSSHRT
jgi:hypothetical protein